MNKKEFLTDEEISKLTFEQSLERLELIVDKLESGEIPLEHSIDLFQEGMKLASRCQKKLENVELKIEEIFEKDGEIIKRNFDYSEDKE